MYNLHTQGNDNNSLHSQNNGNNGSHRQNIQQFAIIPQCLHHFVTLLKTKLKGGGCLLKRKHLLEGGC